MYSSQSIYISIPQWCDKNLYKEVKKQEALVFQFLNGAIKTVDSIALMAVRSKFQFLNGAIKTHYTM